MKVRITGLLEESCGHLGISPTEGQDCGKRFHTTMTSLSHSHHHNPRRCSQAGSTDIYNTFYNVCRRLWWWRYEMEKISALLALCDGNQPVTFGFPSQRNSNAGFVVFFDAKQRARQTDETPVIWDARVLIMTSLYCWWLYHTSVADYNGWFTDPYHSGLIQWDWGIPLFWCQGSNLERYG